MCHVTCDAQVVDHYYRLQNFTSHITLVNTLLDRVYHYSSVWNKLYSYLDEIPVHISSLVQQSTQGKNKAY